MYKRQAVMLVLYAIQKLASSSVAAIRRALRKRLARIRAVSYTHLRAHETVLDPVCRLLLEKKNTTQQNYQQFYTYTISVILS